MKEREELELILNLIRKYNLPMSPILDYAIKEKIEEISKPSPFELSEDVSIDDNSVKDFEDFKIKQENTFVENTNDNFNDIEIEHVKLKPHGNVISDSSLYTDNNLDQNDSKDNRKGKPWTKDEDKSLTYFYNQGRGVETLAKLFGRTEVAIKSRLGKLGLIDYTYGQD